MTEFLTQVETALSGQIDGTTLADLGSIEADLQCRQQSLVRQLDSGEITPKQYLDHFNSALRSAMHRSRVTLGDERFDAVFGEAGKNPESLIDARVFLRMQAKA